MLKQKIAILTIAASALMPLSAQAANKVIVIPMESSSGASASASTGLDFDVYADATNFTSQSQNWTLSGTEGQYISFITDKGYFFQVDWRGGYKMPYQYIYFDSTDCTGTGYIDQQYMQRQAVFRAGTDLFYVTHTDPDLGIKNYESRKDRDTGNCLATTGSTSATYTRTAHANNSAVTGVNLTDPTNVIIVPRAAE